MKISEPTLSALGSIITGEYKSSPYRSGQQLVNFFNQFGAEDIYGAGFPSRWKYAEDTLRKFNDKPIMKEIILAAFDPRHYIDTEHNVSVAVEHLNKFLDYDGYEVEFSGKKRKVRKLNEMKIVCANFHDNSTEVTHIFIDEQIEKCEKKLDEGDFDGAITNARSLVEAVLYAIEKELDLNANKYDGNLQKLYKRVQKILNLCPGQDGLEDCLKQILSGFVSIISGLATLRNTVSDAHVRSYKPAEHHARLAVNSATTLCNFLFDTKEYQISKNKNI